MCTPTSVYRYKYAYIYVYVQKHTYMNVICTLKLLFNVGVLKDLLLCSCLTKM